MLASVVISTYNRAAALPATLDALAHQDVPSAEYEVLVVDDGSTDGTAQVLLGMKTPYRLRTFRLGSNRGVSAGRNVGLENAEGEYIIMISDDLIVPENFISEHVATLRRFSDAWVVGGFSQLDTLADTPFGLFLAELEEQFEQARTGARIDHHLFEMTTPTARNLSMPRSDLTRVGLFDERFRVTCEDQDLAERAATCGVRFIYNTRLECVHNDQAADLHRYCAFQQRGARDTVRLCEKYPERHSQAPIVTLNAYVLPTDGVARRTRKVVKSILATRSAIRATEMLIEVGERRGWPERVLRRAYRFVIGLYTFRGFREGLRDAGGRRSPLMQYLMRSSEVGSHVN
jgi:glycosyltransferase involved in cell wall biosynthesis